MVRLMRIISKQRLPLSKIIRWSKLLIFRNHYIDLDNNGTAPVLGKFTELPTEFSLSQNYPNPFNPSTVIRYSLIGNGFTSLKIYDITGKEVANLVNESKIPEDMK